jgi:transketolase
MKPELTKNAHQQLKQLWEGKKKQVLEKEATRQGFGKGLLTWNKEHKSLFALTANLGNSTGLNDFAKIYPTHCIDVGVAEQTLAGVAAGIASEGYSVVMTSFAVFSPGRNWDFIRTQIVMNHYPVIIVGSHAGLATGEDGATHQALEDVALMRSLPGITILSPCDGNEAAALTQQALALAKPVYLRLVREKTPQLTTGDYAIGKGSLIVKGDNIILISTGTMLIKALESSLLLWKKYKLSASVLHLSTIKPLDIKELKKALDYKLVVTIEDHNIIGGLGSAIAEFLSEQQQSPPLLRLGVNEAFGQSGTMEELYTRYGLDEAGITQSILNTLKKSKQILSARKKQK